MKFRLKNISNKNHRVTMRATDGEAEFYLDDVEPGDVVLEDNYRLLNACLSGLKGPNFTCVGATSSIYIGGISNFPGKLYVDGNEFTIGEGETFAHEINDNPILSAMLTATLDDDLGVTIASKSLGKRIAVVRTDGQPIPWQFPEQYNTSWSIENDTALFCTADTKNYDLSLPSTGWVGRNFDIRYYLNTGGNSEITLKPDDVTITIVEGEGEIVEQFTYDTYGYAIFKPTSVGELVLEIRTRDAGENEYNRYVINVAAIPSLLFELPVDQQYHLLAKDILINDSITTWSNGSSVSNVTYEVVEDLSIPELDRATGNFQWDNNSNYVFRPTKEGKIGFRATAYSPAYQDYVYSETKSISVLDFAVRDNLQNIPIQTNFDMDIVCKGNATIPDGWSVNFVAGTGATTPNGYFECSPDPDIQSRFKCRGLMVTEATKAMYIDVRDQNGVQRDNRYVPLTLIGAGSVYLTATTPPSNLSGATTMLVRGYAEGVDKLGSTAQVYFGDRGSAFSVPVNGDGYFEFPLGRDNYNEGVTNFGFTVTVKLWNDTTASASYGFSSLQPRKPLVLSIKRGVPMNVYASSNNNSDYRGGIMMVDGKVNCRHWFLNKHLKLDWATIEGDTVDVEVYPAIDEEVHVRYRVASTNDSRIPTLHAVKSWGTLNEQNTYTFENATSLVSVPDHSPQVSDYRYMFRGCTKLNDPNLKGWDMSNSFYVEQMLGYCTSFAQDLSGWCVPYVTAGSQFAAFSGMPSDYLPVWGTCPNG